MLQSKSQYLKKIEELHKQVEEKARELQKVCENIDKAKRDRERLLISVEASRNVLTDLRLDNFTIRKNTNEWRETKNKEVKEYEVKIKVLKLQIIKLEEEEKELKIKQKELIRIQRDIQDHKDRLKLATEDCSSLKQQKSTLFAEVSELEKEKRALDREIEQARGKADKILESAELTAKDAHKFYQSMGPWISGIAQWHAVHGGEMPELLHEWKPKSIYVPRSVYKKLKEKQI